MQRKYHMKSSERSRLFRWMGIIILCLMLFGCLYVCTKKGDQETPGTRADRVEQILSEMTLKDKVEQMMVVSFREWKESPTAQDVITVDNKEVDEKGDNVTELNDIFRETLRTHHFGGVYLFSENYDCAEQTLKLVADFQKTTVEGGCNSPDVYVQYHMADITGERPGNRLCSQSACGAVRLFRIWGSERKSAGETAGN